MVSLKQSIDQYVDACSQAVTTLCLVIEAQRQYAVETDPAAVEQLRAHLANTVDQLRRGASPPDNRLMDSLPSTIGCELREYRDLASVYIDHLRTTLKEAAEALNEITQTFQATDSGAQVRLKTTIAELGGLASLENLIDVRAGLRQATTSLMECAEQLRRERDTAVIQLRDEIRSLQKSVQHAERAATIDPATGVYKREEFQKLVLRDVVAERPVEIIHVWLRNLQELRSSHSENVIDELLMEFCKRVGNVVPSDAMIGHWCGDVFCILVPSELARRTAGDLMRGCVGRYLCLADGAACTINVDGVATCVRVQSHESAEALFAKLDKLHFALSH